MSHNRKKSNRVTEALMMGGWAAIAALALAAKPLGWLLKAGKPISSKAPKLAAAMRLNGHWGEEYVFACRDGKLDEAKALRERHRLSRFDLEAFSAAASSAPTSCSLWLSKIINPASKDHLGRTPLLMFVGGAQIGAPVSAGQQQKASAERQLEMLKSLAKRSAEAGVLNDRDYRGENAFAVLANRSTPDSAEAIKVLIDAGADVFSLDHDDQRAIDAIENDQLRQTALSWAERATLDKAVQKAGPSVKRASL